MPTKQELSLNGAQVTSMIEVVSQVAHGELPRDSGLAILQTAFPISGVQAESILGDIGRGFKPATPVEQEATHG